MGVASNLAVNNKANILEKSSVSASVSSERRVPLALKLKKKASLTTKHKVERLRFAKERMHWKKKWRSALVISLFRGRITIAIILFFG